MPYDGDMTWSDLASLAQRDSRDFADNAASPVQGDRLAALRKFA